MFCWVFFFSLFFWHVEQHLGFICPQSQILFFLFLFWTAVRFCGSCFVPVQRNFSVSIEIKGVGYYYYMKYRDPKVLLAALTLELEHLVSLCFKFMTVSEAALCHYKNCYQHSQSLSCWVRKRFSVSFFSSIIHISSKLAAVIRSFQFF